MDAASNWRVAEALESVRSFKAVAKSLTLSEVQRAIALEEGSKRRVSLLAHLRRLARKRGAEEAEKTQLL